jgi:hypothetical protein
LCCSCFSLAQTDVAMVYASQAAWLNGVPIPGSSALFPGDLVQTKVAPADITAFGSKVLLGGDTVLNYYAGTVELHRGNINVVTSKAFAARVEEITIRPAVLDWTEFHLVENDQSLRIIAAKGDLVITDEHGTTTVPAGQETTRELRKKRRQGGGAIPAAHGSVMDSTAAVLTGTAIVGGITTWVLTRSDDPISPDGP